MPAHVVIYDHTPAVLARFSYTFLQAGFKVTTRHPSNLSIGQLRALNPELIIIGYSLNSSKEELGTVERIREDEFTGHIPVIIATPEEDGITVAIEVANTHPVSFSMAELNLAPVLEKARELVGTGDRR